LGAVDRDAQQVKAEVVPNTQAQTVLPFIAETVDPSATLHTDEYNVYNRLGNAGTSICA